MRSKCDNVAAELFGGVVCRVLCAVCGGVLTFLLELFRFFFLYIFRLSRAVYRGFFLFALAVAAGAASNKKKTSR